MAVVKVKYLRSRPQIKAHLRYIVHRRAVGAETITRPLFGPEGALTKQQIYTMIDATGRRGLFYKFMVSPDPAREDHARDLDLWELTRKTLMTINTRYGPLHFVATIHADHTDNRHVHGFFLVPGRLTRKEFAQMKRLWKVASVEASRQRRLLDRVHANPRLTRLYRSPPREHVAGAASLPANRRLRSFRPQALQSGCSACGYGLLSGIAAYRVGLGHITVDTFGNL